MLQMAGMVVRGQGIKQASMLGTLHTFASSNLPRAFNKLPKSLLTQYSSCVPEGKEKKKLDT